MKIIVKFKMQQEGRTDHSDILSLLVHYLGTSVQNGVAVGPAEPVSAVALNLGSVVRCGPTNSTGTKAPATW